MPTGRGDGTAVELIELEAGRPTLPTAVFYGVEGLAAHEEPRRLYGRAAIAAARKRAWCAASALRAW